MVALYLILACAAVLAAAFKIVVRQVAKARRQQYLEQVALNDLGRTCQPVLVRQQAQKKAQARAAKLRQRANPTPTRRPHSAMLLR